MLKRFRLLRGIFLDQLNLCSLVAVEELLAFHSQFYSSMHMNCERSFAYILKPSDARLQVTIGVSSLGIVEFELHRHFQPKATTFLKFRN